MDTTTQLIEKLQKILARADASRNPSQAEVEAAMLMAQKLAAKHNLDISSIQAKMDADEAEPTLETDHKVVQPTRATEGTHHRYILQTLRECFGVRTIFLPRHDRQDVGFVGTTADVALAIHCFTWLEEMFPKAYLTWRKGMGYAKDRTQRQNFYAGLADGIIELNKRVTEDFTSDEKNRYAMVLVNKEAVVAQRYAVAYPNARKRATKGFRLDPQGYHAGLAKGRSVRLVGGITGGTALVA